MRRWDSQAGKHVADLTRARASDEWRYDERVAELETDLEESRELRTKLEQRLRAKRAELAGLRNEHAALLRRYATAETERASALEGRRLLEIEAAVPSGAPALPPARSGEAEAAEVAESEAAETAGSAEAAEEKPKAGPVFSAEGAQLFLQAAVALSRLDRDGASGKTESAKAEPGEAESAKVESGEAELVRSESGEAESAKAESVDAESVETESTKTESTKTESTKAERTKAEPVRSEPVTSASREAESPKAGLLKPESLKAGSVEASGDGAHKPTAHTQPAQKQPAQEGEAQGKSEAAGGHTRAAAASSTPDQPAKSAGQQPAGHFTVPTAVAVVPATPVRRPAIEGGFDFFGTQKQTASAALESVQNEDLADVVGQEALALHKAEAEAEFKPADEESRGAGQVIDLTAHDETEQIDLQGLRTAAS
ncbi:hypothetical protein ACFWIO_21250 [Streptomyces diastatochromogenes]|uniref:hypothetical protein n=1 Tax=Streptomyces diastatochromogenes TaxID=42236 RepID=UPI003665BE91